MKNEQEEIKKCLFCGKEVDDYRFCNQYCFNEYVASRPYHNEEYLQPMKLQPPCVLAKDDNQTYGYTKDLEDYFYNNRVDSVDFLLNTSKYYNDIRTKWQIQKINYLKGV